MGTTEIVIIVVVILFFAFLTNGWPTKRSSSSSLILALVGLLLLPVAHIVASYFVVDIANEAVKQCTMDQGNPVGNDLSQNLGVFNFIGESIEEQLNEGYSEEIRQHLSKAINYRKWPQILMYASLIAIFIDLICFYFRGTESKKFILIMRGCFTLAICYFVYSGMIIVYDVSSTRLAAKTYGLFELIGGTSYAYGGTVALISVAFYLIPLLILHLIHFKCANRYFESEEEYDYVAVESEPTDQSTPIAASEPQTRQYSQKLIQEQSLPSPAEDTGETGIEQLDELLHAGILTEEEYDAEKCKIAPSQQDENTKIGMLRKLKKLLDADILTPEEYDKEKMEILFTEKIPVWVSGKTKVETLIEYKKLLDDGILAQDEFDYTKMDILRRS